VADNQSLAFVLLTVSRIRKVDIAHAHWHYFLARVTAFFLFAFFPRSKNYLVLSTGDVFSLRSNKFITEALDVTHGYIRLWIRIDGEDTW
jgi:hypothetical protein